MKPAYPELYAHFNQRVRIPVEQWLRMESLLVERRFARDAFLVKAGDPVGDFAVIRSGLARIYYVDKNGGEFTKAFVGPLGIAAAYAELLTERVSRTYIQALEETRALVARYRDFTRLYARHPCWQEMGRRLAEEHYLAKEKREFEFLQLSASDRYLEFLETYPGLAERISQYHIASYLGITAVALSRIVGRLKRKK